MEVEEAVAQSVAGSDPVREDSFGGPLLVVSAAKIVDVLRFLRDDPAHRYEMLIDLTAIDRRVDLGVFEIVYVLRSLEHNTRLTVKVRSDGGDPVVPSATGLWACANWAEREVWDLFGVRFDGHPDLRRILMYEEFEGHPLRKDYPVDRRQPLVEERDPIRDPWPSRDGL